MKKINILILLALISIVSISALPVNEYGKSPFVQIVKNIRSSVVSIKSEGKAFRANFPHNNFPQDELFRRFFGGPPQRFNERKSSAMGSGFIFRQAGDEVYIMTNNHVIQLAADDGDITVMLADKDEYKAEIVGRDPLTDLAVIKIKVDEKVVVAPFGSSENIEVGEWAIAIGNPFGQLGLERTVTVGVISAKGRSNLNFGNDSPLYQDYIQTDAAINPGNSGGPLVNIKGKVIGVNAAITSPGGGGNIGIGFAIPSEIAEKVAADILSDGKVIRGYLGIFPQELSEVLRKSMQLDENKGILVARVEEDTPAAKAGFKNGDVIIKFNKQDITNVARFRLIVADCKVGKKVPIEIIRNGKTKKLTAKLEERPR